MILAPLYNFIDVLCYTLGFKDRAFNFSEKRVGRVSGDYGRLFGWIGAWNFLYA